MNIQKLSQRISRILLSEAQAILMAVRWGLWFEINKASRYTGMVLELLVSNAIILLISLPFHRFNLSEKPRFAEHKNYLAPAVMTTFATITIYECFYRTSESFSLASTGFAYPLALAMIFAITGRVRGSQTRLLLLCLALLMNVGIGLRSTSFANIVSCSLGAVQVVICIVLTTSSDFITGCATNDMDFFKFLQGRELYALATGAFFVVVTGHYPNIVFGSFVVENLSLCLFYVVIEVASRISSVYYIKKLGVISYSTTKIPTFIYFSLSSRLFKSEKKAELPPYFALLCFYLFTTILFGYTEIFDNYLNFAI
jgi:hypothetical protein